MRTLFIGNSHTYFNDMPAIFKNLCKEQGIDMQITMLTKGGMGLDYHAENEQTRFNILYGEYDFVILQHVAHPMGKYDAMEAAADKIVSWIRESGAVPCYYMTWTEEDNEAFQAEMAARYRKLAGKHECLLAPVGENKKKAGCKEGYKLYFDGVDVIRHHGNDVATGLALREDIEMPLDHGYVTITNEFFDRCTYMVEGDQTKCVGIADEEGKHIVDVCFDTPLFAIWSPEKKDAPFICIEPWYGRCDAADFDGDLSEREYTNNLAAGESFEGGYTMKFYEYYW